MENHYIFMGKSTISVAIFNSKRLVYQRLPIFFWGRFTLPKIPENSAPHAGSDESAAQGSWGPSRDS
jgi:hypothetical protein